ncbi:MAG: hypothetical protein AAGA68_21480 [Pseudomonadota bacterium]
MSEGSGVDKLIGGCALVASLAAVFIAWDQGRVMRAQQHGEVFPVLQVDGFIASMDEQVEVGLRVSNNGVGPAMIEAVDLAVDGVQVNDLQMLLADLPPPSSNSWSSLAGRAMAPGEEVEVLSLRWNGGDVTPTERAAIAAFTERASEWHLRICYCSVFRRCWATSRTYTARADRVARCELRDTDVFSDFDATVPR